MNEKEIKKNKIVSRVEPINVETKGALHQVPCLSRSKIVTSNNCAQRNAVADPIAILIVTAGAINSGAISILICVPIREHTIPTTNPKNTTRRASAGPYILLIRSVTKNANG